MSENLDTTFKQKIDELITQELKIESLRKFNDWFISTYNINPYISQYFHFNEGEYVKNTNSKLFNVIKLKDDSVYESKEKQSALLHFHRLKCLSINWCIKTQLRLDYDLSLSILKNVIFTEGLILLHSQVLTLQRYIASIVYILVSKCWIEKSTKISFKDIIRSICEEYEYISQNEEKLKNWIYKGKFPNVISLPSTPIINPILKEKDTFIGLLDLSKTKSENVNRLSSTTNLSKAFFYDMINEFNIEGFEKRTDKSNPKNPLITYVREHDDKGSLWTLSPYFIFNVVMFSSDTIREQYKGFYTLVSIDSKPFYLLGDFVDGKLIQTEVQKKIMSIIKKEKSLSGYKSLKGQNRELKDMLKRMVKLTTMTKDEKTMVKDEKKKWKSHYLFPDYLVTEDGRVYSTLTNKFIKPRKIADLGGKDYLVVSLRKTIYEPRCPYELRGMFNYRLDYLVAETYMERPERSYIIHLDDDIYNNSLDNLQFKLFERRREKPLGCEDEEKKQEVCNVEKHAPKDWEKEMKDEEARIIKDASKAVPNWSDTLACASTDLFDLTLSK